MAVGMAQTMIASPLLKEAITLEDGTVMDELEINNYPEWARRQMAYGRNLQGVEERTGAKCQLKGQYYPAGQEVPVSDRKLYIEVRGSTAPIVQRAKSAVYQMIEAF